MKTIKIFKYKQLKIIKNKKLIKLDHKKNSTRTFKSSERAATPLVLSQSSGTAGSAQTAPRHPRKHVEDEPQPQDVRDLLQQFPVVVLFEKHKT